MPSASTPHYVLMAPVSTMVLFNDALPTSKGRKVHARPVLRTIEAAGRGYFFLACVGKRDNLTSASQILAAGTLQDVLDLKLDDDTELRRLYLLPVPLYDTGELECERILSIMRRKFDAPDGVTHLLFPSSGQTETVPYQREQFVDFSSGLDEFEDLLELPKPDFDQFGQQI